MLTDNEIKILERKYDDGLLRAKQATVATFIFSLIAIFLPVKVWNYIIMLDDLPEVTEPMYQNPIFVTILIFVIFITPFFTYYAFVSGVKKDLKTQEKITGTYQVESIEHLSKKVAENLDGLDTVLHFAKNENKIKRHLFNKELQPELLDAKSIYIEYAKYSRTTFKEEIQY